jgi:uncharacterized protein (DUF58 family)
VLIYPRLHRVHRRVLLRLSAVSPTGSQRLDKSGGNEEFFGLRPYRPGDSMKTIDWKHTARTGDLVAREMTQPTPPRLMLLLDLTAANSLSLEAEGRAEDARRRGLGPDNSEHKHANHPPPAPPSREGGQTARTQTPAWRRWLRVLIYGKGGDGADDEPDRRDPAEQAISLAASLVCDAHFHGYQLGLAVRGARCQSFPIHHSLPHRTRLLEALAQVELDAASPGRRRADEPAALPAEPSIVIVPGPAIRARGLGRATVMATDHMNQYVRESEDDAAAILDRRTLTPSRRRQLVGEGVGDRV